MALTNKWLLAVQELVQTGMQIAGDLNSSVVYTNVTGPSAYDTATGLSTLPSTNYTFNGIVSRLEVDEIDPKVSSRSSTESIRSPGVVLTDAKLTCAYLDLQIEPTTQDTMQITIPGHKAARTWKVMKVLSPPGSPMWSLHIQVV